MGKHLRLALAVVALAVLGLAVPGGTETPEPTVSFTASGDFAATTNTQAVLSSIASLDRDAHWALGDLSYGTTGAEQDWCDFVTSRVGAGFPFELLAGNHEANGQNGNINDFSACLPNQLPGLVGTYGRQYYVDVPAEAPLVRYVMISPGTTYPDGTWSYAAGTPRYNWTASAIDGARGAGIPWVVVGMHKPCLSLGQYGCEPGTDLHDLLISRKVDLVMSGHEHLYQRTHQLGHGTSCPSIAPGTVNQGCIVDSDQTMSKGRGTVMATIGTGGTTLRNVNTGDTELGYFATWSGANVNPTWGNLDVSVTADRLTANFVRASGGTFTDSFTIERDTSAPNVDPTASFTSSCDALTCSFNGGGSTDSDGTIVSYVWDHGDGTTATGPTSTRTYTSAGTYTVSLTVTDDRGGTATTTRTVTVTAPPAGEVIARDDFTRTDTNGFGTAPVGGDWAITGTSSNFSVDGGTGRIQINAGSGRTAVLPGVSSTATDVRAVLSTDKPGGGSGLYASVIGRRTSGGDYRAKVRIEGGTVTVALVRTTSSGAETTLANFQRVVGHDHSSGGSLDVRFQVTGTGPTQLRAKVWTAGTAEPADWLVSATDTTAALQSPGSVGVFAYLSGSAANAPITLGLDDLVVAQP